MVNVAIAGGTGAVGRTLVEVLASQEKHHAIILTRKVLSLSQSLRTDTLLHKVLISAGLGQRREGPSAGLQCRLQ